MKWFLHRSLAYNKHDATGINCDIALMKPHLTGILTLVFVIE